MTSPLNRRHWLRTACCLAAPLPLAARAQAPAPAPAFAATPAAALPPLKVVTSFSILADLARQVGGPLVQVTPLIGPDTDAHGWQPRPQDVRGLAQADLVVVNGLGFEGWLQRLLSSAGYKGPLLVASEGITPRRIGPAADPHVWQDLARVQQIVRNLRDALLRLRPDAADTLNARAAAYGQQLAALHQRTRERLAAVPAERRRVLVAHDAFGYFGDAYGVEFLAARGRHSHSEATAADVARLIDQIRRQRVSAVFLENVSDPRLMERIAREGGVQVVARLFSDALSAPGGKADTFLKMFEHNADAVASALGAP